MWRNCISQNLFRNFRRLPLQVRCMQVAKPDSHDAAGKISSWPKPADKVPEGQGCPVCQAGLHNFGYRDVLLLRQFLTPAGLLIGRRQTGVCRKMQRRLAKAIRRSRKMGLLPNFSDPKLLGKKHSKPS